MITNFHPYLILLTIVLNALFVMSEFTLIRIIKPQFSENNIQDNLKSRLLERIEKDLNTHIFASQIGISATTILYGALTFSAFIEVYSNFLEDFNIHPLVLRSISIFLAFLVVLFLYSLFAEYIPKLFTVEKMKHLSKTLIPFIVIFTFLAIPLIYSMRGITNLLFKLSKQKPNLNIYNPIYSEEELLLLIERSQTEGRIDKYEQKMIKRIFDFTDMRVNSILTPRIDVVAIEIDENIEEFKNIAKSSKFSKFPIYKDNLENIVGILHLKDLIYNNFEKNQIDILKIKRNFLSIHEGMKLDKLLRNMRNKHTHIAIVFDEYGVFAGIVTLEDVLGALVGNLYENIDDNNEDLVIQLSPYSYKIHSNITIKRFNKIFNQSFDSDNSVVMSGLILEHCDGLPKTNDKIEIDNIKFVHFQIEGNRIINFTVDVDDAAITHELIELIKDQSTEVS